MTVYFCQDVKKTFFVSSGTSGGFKVMVNSRPGSLAAAFRMPKPAGTVRVFVIGESAAALLGSGPGMPLRSALDGMLPGRAVEVINAGMGAYDSRRIYGVLEEVLAYNPDLIVILSGNNETGKEFCPDFRSELVRRNRSLRSRIASLTMPAEDAAVSASLALHEERLRGMARLAAKKGVPTVLCTLPANLRDYAPDGDLPLDQPELLKGMAALEKKDPSGALEFLEANLAANPREPFSLFYSGRALEELGRLPQAAAAYSQAVKYDPAADRCSAERNSMIRRVAGEEGAAVADLELAFSETAPGGITGGAQLADGVHWFSAYNPFVSAVIAGTAKGILPGAGPPPAASAPSRDYGGGDFEKLLSFAVSYVADGKFCDTMPNERAVIMLQRLCRLDCARLESTLASPERLRATVRDSVWSPGLKDNIQVWRTALLYNAAEMLRRNRRQAGALRLASEADRLQTRVDKEMRLPGACPALNILKGRLLFSGGKAAAARAEWEKAARSPGARKILVSLNAALGLGLALPPPAAAPVSELARPVSAEAAAAKKISDAAVDELRRGGYHRAKELLLAAVERDGNNFEVRMNLCFLAGETADVPLGEEHCGVAVYLSAFPEKHSIMPKDSGAAALYSRALFHFKVKKREEGCQDLKKALEVASAGWPPAPEARERERGDCTR
jgi:tetratricopeptide (TPR) repeat protein